MQIKQMVLNAKLRRLNEMRSAQGLEVINQPGVGVDTGDTAT